MPDMPMCSLSSNKASPIQHLVDPEKLNLATLAVNKCLNGTMEETYKVRVALGGMTGGKPL